MKKKVPLKLKKITKCMMQSGGLVAVSCHLDQAGRVYYQGEPDQVRSHLAQAALQARAIRFSALERSITSAVTRIARMEKEKPSEALAPKLIPKLKDMTKKAMIKAFKDCGAADDLKKICK